MTAGREAAPGREAETPLKRGQRGGDPGKRWMLAFQAGDERAFDEIVRHYHDGVRRFVGRYFSDPHRAEDISQEAFVRVYRARKRYRPTAKFHTWLYTIVTRLCLNEIRSRRRERRAIPIQSGVGPQPDIAEADPARSIPDPRTEAPQAVIEREELEDVLRDAIDGLPDNQRIAILLLRFHEASYREIAEVLGISTMAVKSLVNRAREALRGKLGRYRAGHPRGA